MCSTVARAALGAGTTTPHARGERDRRGDRRPCRRLHRASPHRPWIRSPPRASATPEQNANARASGRASKSRSGDARTRYEQTWDGTKYDVTSLGMWDDASIDGPSCLRLPPLHLSTRAELEEVYLQAKNTYFSGQPIVDDAFFDAIETRLKHLGSDVARKYPRCSRRDMTVFGDAEADYEQMGALAATWAGFVFLGIALMGLDVKSAVDAGALEGVFGFGGGGGDGPGLGLAETAGTTRPAARAPILAALGGFLAQTGCGKLASLRDGNTIAMSGDCPNCAERVYAFLPANSAAKTVKLKSDCHVCGRGLTFAADVQSSKDAPYGKVASGRIYLVSRTDDYYDGGAAPRWPPAKARAKEESGGL